MRACQKNTEADVKRVLNGQNNLSNKINTVVLDNNQKNKINM